MQHLDSDSPPTPPPTASSLGKIGVAVNLSDEDAYAVSWAVKHYLRQGVVLFHKDAEEDVVSTANSVVGNIAGSSVAEINTANSVLLPTKETYVEEIEEILRLYKEDQLSRGDLKELIDRVYDQILEEELMDNTDQELLMNLLENERRQQSHTSIRHKRAKHRHT
ncbi:hypothetical protein KIW84_056948 [Lathyrus oleraceus]|uniref:Uncharacterized protein n=1 Tax=Pisum sativum TaxID=3888 RepID=A0A9D4WZP2_PEA|nr:hypothetical protein KIW84_056948 [Pisum sativum]